MTPKSSSGHVEVNVSLGASSARRRNDPDSPFILAVCGDFSGRLNRGISESIGTRRIWRIDCDNFKEIIGRLDPRLRLMPTGTTGEPIDLRFGSLEDFHPDRILTQATPLRRLLEQRRRLMDPATRASAKTELQALLGEQPGPPAGPAQMPAAAEADDDTMARLLGGVPQRPGPSASSKAGADIERFIQQIVSPTIVPGASAQEMALLSVTEMELTSQLRLILQHPDFQALEAAWRGMDLLVSQFGAEENLRLLIIDISKEELAADLRGRDVESSGVFELTGRQMEEQPWAVWLGLYSFAPMPADIEQLGSLARIAMHAGAPFVSGASSQIVGCDSFDAHPDPTDWKLAMPSATAQAWDGLRKSREAAHAGLALPRFLLRQPYGKSSEAIESFPFEELRPDAPHESYLWGNPALLCGYLLAAAFQESGWDLAMNGPSEISDLPVHTFKKEAETKMKPCAEAWLSERAAQTIVAAGLMPVASVKDRGAVRVLAFQSLAGHPISIG